MSGSAFDAVDLDALRRRRTVKWQLYGPDVLAAWVAEMDFDIAPAVRDALLDAIDRQELGYAPPDTSPVTSACAAFLADTYGWDVSPARIFLVADVLEGIAKAFDVFVPAGRPIVVPTPAYPPFFDVVRLAGRTVVEAPLVVDSTDRWVLDLDRIDAALRDGAAAVLLCTPHNPTGRVFTRDELAALAAIVDRRGARVVSDEVHAPLVYAPNRHVPYATVSDTTARHTVTVTSASKAWNIPGLKCAQVVMSNHEDAARWRALPLFFVRDGGPLGLVATTAAYESGREWLRDLVSYLDGNRRALGAALTTKMPGVSFRMPDATFLAWIACNGVAGDDPARFFLDRAHVALNPGADFGTGFGDYVRCNFGTSRALLDKIVDALAGALPTNER